MDIKKMHIKKMDIELTEMRTTLKIFALISLSTVLIIFTVLFTGCEFLQNTLSTSQQEKLLEATGSPSYNYKVWYYNGISGEDMNRAADSSSDEYFAQTLKVDFGQKVALSSYAPSGKMVINYLFVDYKSMNLEEE